jgi:predicted lipoprotein with Yx(FWY)xxD motif
MIHLPGFNVRTVMNHGQRQSQPWRLLGRLSGAGLVVATGAIHLDLYLTGYRSIPTIGWLFLFQVISAFGLAAVILASKARLVAAAGAGFCVSTLGGYLLSVWVGLFNFKETRTTAGILAGVIEITAFGVLSLVALDPRDRLVPASERSAHRVDEWFRAAARNLRANTGAACLLAAGLLAIAAAGSGSTGPGSVKGSVELAIAKIKGVTVVTNAKGFTLYWFSPDSASKSRCYATCAAYWPPVAGTPTPGPGVTGKLGTIRRSDGSLQATYEGHLLYGYIGDSAPGQANGNGLNLNGGLWHEVTVSGTGG